MNVKPVAGPASVQPQTSMNTSSRQRAITAFNNASNTPASTPQAHPEQLNQNAIMPEDMSAIVPPTQSASSDSQSEQQPQEQPDQEPKEEQKEEQKPDPALTRQFAQLARQEKALRAKVMAQEQAIKAREAAVTAKEAELAAKDQTYSSEYIPKSRFKIDPINAMAEAGVSYDELTQRLLNQQPSDPRMEALVSELKSEIQALKSANETSQNTYKQQQQDQYQAAVKQIRLDTKNLVEKDPNFELIKATGSINDVVDLITQTYDKDGVLLSVEEAAQEIEAYLEEETTKLTRVDKIKRKLQSVAPTTSEGKQTQPSKTPPQPQPMKTLTNATSSTRQLSARERAILAFKGQLK